MLSKVFRGKYLDSLAGARRKCELRLNPDDGGHAFEHLTNALRFEDWVVYVKAQFANASQALDCLGRYTHKTEITHHLLVNFAGEQVRFQRRDFAHGDKVKVIVPEIPDLAAPVVRARAGLHGHREAQLSRRKRPGLPPRRRLPERNQ